MNAQRRGDAAMLTAYLEGEVTASERASIDGLLLESAEARRTLEQLRNASELLAAPATELEGMDLATRVRSALRQPGSARPHRSAWRFAPHVVGGLAACAAICGLFLLLPRSGDDGEFRTKSNQLKVSEGNRWAGIQVYRVSDGGGSERLGPRITAHDALSFSYTNLGAHPFRYLMVFAVDAKNQVRWFYPAYETTGTNPESIAIERGRANVSLGELVQHDFADGRLSLFALFTNTPANVLEIEEWVTKHGRPEKEPPVAGGVLQRIDTRVER